jgi:hypothetical protein
MATEKQRLANQQNALKSTGPKTAEGKENSKRNALKHGMAGSGKVLKHGDDRKLQKTLEAWRERLQPIDVFEEHLVARAALASVRMERCVKKDLAEVARRRRRARKRWEQRQERAVNRAASLIDTDPGQAIEQLEATSLGCHWLIERWLDLGAFLEEPGWWDIKQTCFAMRLLGKDHKKTPAKDPSLAKLRLAFLSAGPNIDPVEADAIFEESTRHLDDEARLRRITSRRPDPPIGRAMLQKIVADEITRLESLRDQLWEEQDARDRQEAEDRSLVDTSPTGARLLRYETAAEMSLQRNLNLLIRVRKVEPEHQTLSRWDKEGIKHGRIWDGSGWRYCEAEDSAPVAEPNLEALVARSREASESSAEIVLEEPERANTTGTLRADPAADVHACGSGDAARSVARSAIPKEANFSEQRSDQRTAYVDSQPGSRTASQAVTLVSAQGGDHLENESPPVRSLLRNGT